MNGTGVPPLKMMMGTIMRAVHQAPDPRVPTDERRVVPGPQLDVVHEQHGARRQGQHEDGGVVGDAAL